MKLNFLKAVSIILLFNSCRTSPVGDSNESTLESSAYTYTCIGQVDKNWTLKGVSYRGDFFRLKVRDTKVAIYFSDANQDYTWSSATPIDINDFTLNKTKGKESFGNVTLSVDTKKEKKISNKVRWNIFQGAKGFVGELTISYSRFETGKLISEVTSPEKSEVICTEVR